MSDLKRTNKGNEINFKLSSSGRVEVIGAIVGVETRKIKLTKQAGGKNV